MCMRPKGKGDLARFPDADPQTGKPSERLAVGLSKGTSHWQVIRYSQARRWQGEPPELRGAWDSAATVWAGDRAAGGRIDATGAQEDK